MLDVVVSYPRLSSSVKQSQWIQKIIEILRLGPEDLGCTFQEKVLKVTTSVSPIYMGSIQRNDRESYLENDSGFSPTVQQ
ncbi:hypothetical protein TNCV_2403861 [Trichonephila clavipes]|nr:hypothetical protein TNCV_2403861 [Trichonephila clavipes]